MKNIISFLFLILSLQLIAQSSFHKSYNWDEKPVRVGLNDEDQNASSVCILDTRIIEYLITNTTETILETQHNIIRVNDDKAIDYHNKVFIPMTGVKDIVEIKARSIDKEGNITELKKDNIKELKNVEEYGNYKIFAIEGAKVGSDLEYYYQIVKSANNYGKEIMQSGIKTKEANFYLITPDFLHIRTKSYNGFPDLKQVEEKKEDGFIINSAQLIDLPAMRQEEYSAMRSNFMKVVYKSSSLSWKNLATYYSSIIYTKEKSKKIKSLLKELKIKRLKKEEDKIIAIEKYIKNNIVVRPSTTKEQSNVNAILNQKFADDIGLIKLYAAIFKYLDIEHQLVVTSNRYEHRVDKDFVDYTGLTDVLIYFPKFKKYISPERIEYRFGIAPNNIGGNNGVYILNSQKAEVQPIKISTAEQSVIHYTNKISFDEDMEHIIINKKRKTTGHRAFTMRASLKYADNVGKRQLEEWLFTSGVEEAEILSSKISNEDVELSSDISIPFISEASIKAPSLLESAGNKYLLKVGLVIGTQSELYQETERMNDIDFENPKTYRHFIQIEIPKGYTIKNLDACVIERYLKIDDEIVAQFVSEYEQKGNMVEIRIVEFYKQHQFPKSMYKPFREVINAAADFNKVVLVLEEK